MMMWGLELGWSALVGGWARSGAAPPETPLTQHHTGSPLTLATTPDHDTSQHTPTHCAHLWSQSGMETTHQHSSVSIRSYQSTLRWCWPEYTQLKLFDTDHRHNTLVVTTYESRVFSSALCNLQKKGCWDRKWEELVKIPSKIFICYFTSFYKFQLYNILTLLFNSRVVNIGSYSCCVRIKFHSGVEEWSWVITKLTTLSYTLTTWSWIALTAGSAHQTHN